jgi:hypothetical protein
VNGHDGGLFVRTHSSCRGTQTAMLGRYRLEQLCFGRRVHVIFTRSASDEIPPKENESCQLANRVGTGIVNMGTRIVNAAVGQPCEDTQSEDKASVSVLGNLRM